MERIVPALTCSTDRQRDVERVGHRGELALVSDNPVAVEDHARVRSALPARPTAERRRPGTVRRWSAVARADDTAGRNVDAGGRLEPGLPRSGSKRWMGCWQKAAWETDSSSQSRGRSGAAPVIQCGQAHCGQRRPTLRTCLSGCIHPWSGLGVFYFSAGGDAPSDWPAECTTFRRKSYCAWTRPSAISRPESITCCRQEGAAPSRGSA